MFLVIVAAALYAGSLALLADSLGNLGDALTYGLSLWAVYLGLCMKARVVFFKGFLILLAALAVRVQAHKPHRPVVRGNGHFHSARTGGKWLMPCSAMASQNRRDQHVLGMRMFLQRHRCKHFCFRRGRSLGDRIELARPVGCFFPCCIPPAVNQPNPVISACRTSKSHLTFSFNTDRLFRWRSKASWLSCTLGVPCQRHR